MATAEWSSEEAQPASLPQMVSSADLFVGELFGDELMDIYNSSVVEGVEIHDIPNLDHPVKEGDADEDHPTTRTTVTADGMGDGLGAFRPSTSFNDLANLIQPQVAAESSEITVPRVIPMPEVTTTTKVSTRKRQASTSSDSPPSKRKTYSRSRRNTASKKNTTSMSKKVASETINCDAVPMSVVSLSEDAEVTAAAVEAATAAAVAVAASFPVLPDFSLPKVTSGLTLTMKSNDKLELALSAPQAVTSADNVSSDTSSIASSDTQFKSVAQQAVSNLIMNVNSGSARMLPKVAASASLVASTSDDESSDDKSKVDTSTAHIKALTGNNWVAACSGGSTTGPASPPMSSGASVTAGMDKANRVRRQNLTPDERARQNRDRNREHARNTRLRKKAYVEELKRTLTELVAQRDASELEKRQTAQRELEQREVRFRVIEEFLKLRGRNESSFARWAAILEESFVLTVPLTGLYRSTDGGELVGFEQKLNSVELVMAESTVFASFLQTLRNDGEGPVTLVFDCDRKKFFMDGCNAVLEWTASTTGAKEVLQVKGLMRSKFSPASNKLLWANIAFDCGAIAAQMPTKNSLALNDDLDVAAQADAILDSLEINHVHLNVVVPSDVSVPVNSSASVSDESTSDHHDGTVMMKTQAVYQSVM